METLTTHGITISVDKTYQETYSNPLKNQFVFTYNIHIENNSDHTVQLLRRHWYIHDSNGIKREVEGEGVIGEQPILHPGDSHQYSSWSPLLSEIGKMFGTFLMERKKDKRRFKVNIPEFQLVATSKLN